MLPFVRELLQLLLRANLMLFYFEGDPLLNTLIVVIRHVKESFLNLAIISSVGLYYHISKRAAGIRYVFIGKASNQRPRYRVLKLY